MQLRPYRTQDCPALAGLFYDTVHTVNARNYTPPQLDAWADGHADLAVWDGVIVGFGDMASDGYLDRLYVHKDYQGRGIATALCDALEQAVPGLYTTHASITARPFFEHRGYRVVREQQVERKGILLTNFVMQKD